jgi:hypothetical protein
MVISKGAMGLMASAGWINRESSSRTKINKPDSTGFKQAIPQTSRAAVTIPQSLCQTEGLEGLD